MKGNLIVGARSFPGNPYDGHTLAEALEQTSILLQDAGIKPVSVYSDLGYRGVDGEIPEYSLKHRGKYKWLTKREQQLLQRRQAIEPVIGHLKSDHGMDRCHLKGRVGDAIHAVLCAAGFNIKWLLRMIARKGIRPFFVPYFLVWFLLQVVKDSLWGELPHQKSCLKSPEIRPDDEEMNCSGPTKCLRKCCRPWSIYMRTLDKYG